MISPVRRRFVVYLAGLVLLFGAEVLWSLPTACGQVQDGGGCHVCGLCVMGVVVAAGGGGRAALGVAS